MNTAIVIFADTQRMEEEKEEFIELVHACAFVVDNTFSQLLHSIHVKTYIGKGKCEEVRAYLQTKEIDCVIFHKDITPLQIRNLEDIWNVPVMDRSDLILSIFSQRAISPSARLQIESAKLKKALPRLVGANAHLGRQSASGQNKGAGEKQLTLDRRHIKTRIAATTKALKQLEAQRHTQRRARQKSNLPLVSLVGYTNAGKSTIMNALLAHTHQRDHKKVLAQDMLFATLDTSIRKIHLANHSFLLSDTVGFVRDLPHELIDAFHATLEEVTYADLLLEVVDASNQECQKQMQITQSTLRTIHAGDIPILHIFNQCDKTTLSYPIIHGNDIYISAHDQTSIEVLLQHIITHITPATHTIQLCIPYQKSNLYAKLHKDAFILSCEDQEDGMRLQVEINDALLDEYRPYLLSNE